MSVPFGAAALLGAALLAAVFAAAGPASSSEGGRTIAFSPGNVGPVAYNPATGAYEEGASFDPVQCAEGPCIELLHNIFEPLVKTDNSGRIVPWLATAWERRDGGLTYRFELRRGVVFHNGEPFDAEAVRFSLGRAADAYGVTAWFPKIRRIDLVGTRTVDVVLDEPDSLFLYRLGHIGLMLPPDHLRRIGEAEFGRRPVGTGAFRFESWDPKRREVRLLANPTYWRAGYPRVERVVYAYMDPATALERLITGELDLIRHLDPRRTAPLLATGAGRIVTAWLPQIVVGSFNLLRPDSPLHDSRVRQAINTAVNREHLIRYGALGNGRVLGGYTIPGDPLHAALPPYPYSVREARRLLEEAGHGGGLRLSMMVDHQVPPQVDNIVSVSLAAIGVELAVTRATESEFLAEVYLPKFAGERAAPSFDILLLSMPVGTIRHAAMVPMTLLYAGEPNESAVRDARLDRLYEAALRARDPDGAALLWQRIERYVHDNHLLFMGYQEKAVFGAARGLRFTPRTLMSFWDAYFADDVARGEPTAGATASSGQH